MMWEDVLAKLDAELTHIHELIMNQSGSENILKLEQAMAIVIQLKERQFG